MSSHEIDTIVLGVPCTIKFDYQPYEPADTGPEAMYPGCEEEIEIVSVSVGGENIDEWLYSGSLCNMMQDAVYSYLERQRELKEEERLFARYEKEMMYGY